MPQARFRVPLAVPTLLFVVQLSSSPAVAQTDPDSVPATETAPAPAEPDAGEVATAEPQPIKVFAEIDVKERASELVGVAGSATEGATGRADLEQRPILRPGELLETVPGVVITQHSGGGKANQYFLRGFNLDHGTDFRVTAAGVPVNLPTHGHGQGYTDLNFLIPELVDRVEFRKGPYYAEEGDFSAAGASRIELVSSLPQALVKLEGGEQGYRRLLLADSLQAGEGQWLGALELGHNDGPWRRPDDYQKVNGLAKYSRGDSARGFSLTALGYDGSWNATDQIPVRAVASGALDRFGTVDTSDGGAGQRFALSGDVWRGDARSLSRVTTFLSYSDLALFSNFTYFLDDPEHGDQFEQKDRRLLLGGTAKRRWESQWGGRAVEHDAGFDLRADLISNGLFSTERRVRLSTTREDDVVELNPALFWETQVRWSPKVRTTTGLRADGLWVDVDSDLAENSGTDSDAMLSPKASLILGPWKDTELYLNAGYGFHSNDARGATIAVDPKTGDAVGRVPALVRAKGADVGFRSEHFDGWVTSVSVFALELDSEIVFVGDAGTTEAGRPSRRTGIEVTNFFRPFPWLSLDLDATLTRGRFTDDDPAGDRIPGAMERVIAAGCAVEGLHGFFGSVRLRYFGPRPLVEDDSVRAASSTTLNTRLGYDFQNGLRLGFEVFNLTNETNSDIDYYYESRLPGEPAEGVADVHLHPAEPRSVRLIAEWRF